MRPGSPRSRSIAVVAVAALALGAVAPAPPTTPADEGSTERQCFRPQTVRNYRTDHDTTVYVRDLRGQVFELQTTDAAACRPREPSEFWRRPAAGPASVIP